MILVVVVAVIWCPISAKTFSSLNPTSIYTLPIYYVQSQTSNLHIHQGHHDYNCTRESPCHTIQQALQLIITQFNSSVIGKRSGKIILLGDSFGVDQCNIQIPGNCKDERFVHCAAFDEIVLDTELDRGVSLDCDNQRLFKELEVRNLTIHNLNLTRIYIGLNRAPAVDRLILQSVSMYNIQVKDTSEMPINLDKRVVIVESSIVERCTIDLIGKSEIQILQSRVHGTTMHTLQSAISIWNSNLTHFEFLLQTTSDDLENDMLDIRNSFLCNTTLRLDRFKYISFSYATFSDNTFLQVSNSDSISCGNVNAIGGHFYWLFRENNLVTVASSEFSFLNLFDESWSNKLIDIDSCKQLFIFGCSFENNRGIVLGIEFTNILDLQDLSFENNYGNCIYADMSQRRGVSQMTLDSVLFRKNKCSTDMNGCALSVQAHEIFIRNIRCIEHSGASNGGSLYIQAKNTLQIFSSLFLDNLASQLGGAIYIGNSATATFTIENTTCVNNSAQYAGGCIYYESPQQKEASILKDNVFYNNEGKSYGNDIGFHFTI
ncbi:hypothetical protein C9374_004323 [Naegleria lovaniensis]|uniref:Right handed beta helix domain-containing protein n=1 Tax=Naegleria lovaniensis TaxID=51637 RepID=A0AA88GSA1_NAELO|nr:uncharacterized protein C9374_004323 [Naegleria lovaniensis]KAG2383652.1 hypothetical protein C9374_004323 [Naegleria lovaniensis]